MKNRYIKTRSQLARARTGRLIALVGWCWGFAVALCSLSSSFHPLITMMVQFPIVAYLSYVAGGGGGHTNNENVFKSFDLSKSREEK